MKFVAIWLVFLVCVSNTFASSSGFAQAQGINEFYSFENDFEGRTIHGTHLDPALSRRSTQSRFLGLAT
jgi:hypothetical protein